MSDLAPVHDWYAETLDSIHELAASEVVHSWQTRFWPAGMADDSRSGPPLAGRAELLVRSWRQPYSHSGQPSCG